MADGALAVDEVLALRRVTGEAKRAVGYQLRDSGRTVAGVASDVRLHGLPMGGGRRDACVTRRAVATGGVMVFMAGPAPCNGSFGIERDGSRVTRGASDGFVRRMGKRDRPWPLRMPSYGHSNRGCPVRRQLGSRVT